MTKDEICIYVIKHKTAAGNWKDVVEVWQQGDEDLFDSETRISLSEDENTQVLFCFNEEDCNKAEKANARFLMKISKDVAKRILRKSSMSVFFDEYFE